MAAKLKDKQTSITTVPSTFWSFATFLTPLFFHYPLPLKKGTAEGRIILNVTIVFISKNLPQGRLLPSLSQLVPSPQSNIGGASKIKFVINLLYFFKLLRSNYVLVSSFPPPLKFAAYWSSLLLSGPNLSLLCLYEQTKSMSYSHYIFFFSFYVTSKQINATKYLNLFACVCFV